ncbi:unnamed protein product [Scytosiphon promiscuus]
MVLKREEHPSPIQTSDADLFSGPDTGESLISGPQSIKSETSAKTEKSQASSASIKSEASGKSVASTKTEAPLSEAGGNAADSFSASPSASVGAPRVPGAAPAKPSTAGVSCGAPSVPSGGTFGGTSGGASSGTPNGPSTGLSIGAAADTSTAAGSSAAASTSPPIAAASAGATSAIAASSAAVSAAAAPAAATSTVAAPAGAASVTASAPPTSVETPAKSASPQTVAAKREGMEEQEPEDRQEGGTSDAGTARSQSDVPEDLDVGSALSGALCAPRSARSPRSAVVPSELEKMSKVASPVDAKGLASPGFEIANLGGVQGGAGIVGGDFPGQTEGMFRKRVSDDLKAMLRECGGRCAMGAIARNFKRHHGRVQNLNGRKLRVLLTTGRGLYGIGLYGEGQDGEIRLEDRSAVKGGSGSATAGALSQTDDRLLAKPLTRTIVNPDALRHVDVPLRGGSLEADEFGTRGRNKDEDRTAPPLYEKEDVRYRQAVVESRPAYLEPRSSSGYGISLVDAAAEVGRRRGDSPYTTFYERKGLPVGGRHPDAGRRWGADTRIGRGGWSLSRSRSRSRPRRSRSWDHRASLRAGREGRVRPPLGKSRSRSDGRRFARPAVRSNNLRNSLSPRQRSRPRSRSPRGRVLPRGEDMGPRDGRVLYRAESPPRSNLSSRRRSNSRSLRRRSSLGRRSSPGRGSSPIRRSSPGRGSQVGRNTRSSPRRRSSPGRRRSPLHRSSPGRRNSFGEGSSPGRKGSPGRRNGPRGRADPPRKSSTPRRSNSRTREAPKTGYPPKSSPDRARSRRSRDNDLDRAAGVGRRNEGIPVAADTHRDARPRARKGAAESAQRGNPSTSRADHGGRQEDYRAQRQGSERAPPQGRGSAPSEADVVTPAVYANDAVYGAPEASTGGPKNDRNPAVNRAATGRQMLDPVIPLALGGAPLAPLPGGALGGRQGLDPVIPLALGGAPVPPIPAMPGKRRLAKSVVGGESGFTPNDDSPRKRYHAAARLVGNNQGFPSGNGGGVPTGDWMGRQNGAVSGGPSALTANPAPAMLPPSSSLRPVPLPAGRAQGARLMIKGTHPAVPERRIHALASAFGVVGKIEVLEGFVFVHMKSHDEASRAVAGLNGKVVPHVSPQASDRFAGPPLPLTAAIWREDQYQSLISRENMRVYADSMRRASTWYEKQTKSGFKDPLGARMPCRFFALGRGCIFGNNCGFTHEQLLAHPAQAGNAHGGADGPGLNPLATKPQRALPGPPYGQGPNARAGLAPPPFRQARVPVMAHHGQSPTLTFVDRNEVLRRPSPGAPGVHNPDRAGSYAGSGVGVAMPWQPEHEMVGGGSVGAADRASPHPRAGNGRNAEHPPPHHQQQQQRGEDHPARPAEGPKQVRDTPGRMGAAPAAPALESEHARRNGYERNARGVDRSGGRSSGGGGGAGDSDDIGSDDAERGGGKRGTGSRGGGGELSARDAPRGRSRNRDRSDRRESSHVGPGAHRSLSPSPPTRKSRGRASGERRGSGDFEMSARGRQRGSARGDSGGRRGRSRESAGFHGSRHDRRGVDSRHERDSRSNSRRRHLRGDISADRSRGARGGDAQPRRGHESRDRISPARNGRRRPRSASPGEQQRRYDSDREFADLDARRKKRLRRDEGARGGDRGRREDSEEERGSFSRRGGGGGSGSRRGSRRDSDSVNHGWVSLSGNPGAFSRDGERRSFGISTHGGMNRSHSRDVPRRDSVYDVDRSLSRNGSSQWYDDDMHDGSVHDDVASRPIRTKFTVTARLGPVHLPRVAPASSGRPATKFSITMPPEMPGAAGPVSPMSGVRRGGRPAKGRGKGERAPNRHDPARRRPPRDLDDDYVEDHRHHRHHHHY